MNKKWQDVLDKILKPKDIYKYWRLDEEEYVEKIENGYLQKSGKKYGDNSGNLFYDHYESGVIEGFRTYKNMVSCETADIGFDCPYGDEPLYPLYFTPNWGMAKKYSKIEDFLIFIFKRYCMETDDEVLYFDPKGNFIIEEEMYFKVRWMRTSSFYVEDTETRELSKYELHGEKQDFVKGNCQWFFQDKHSYFFLKKKKGNRFDVEELKKEELPLYGGGYQDEEKAYYDAIHKGLKEWEYEGEKWDEIKFMESRYRRFA